VKAKSKSKSKTKAGSKGPRAVAVNVASLAHGAGLPLPSYQTKGAAGLDLVAAIDPVMPWTLQPGERTAVPTGLTLELPPGTEAQVRPRSGLAWKYGVTVLNSPGTVDSDYRGEVQVILINLGSEPFVIRRGDRIAQLVIAPVSQVTLMPVTTLASSGRGAGGFGSTGSSAITDENRKPKQGKKKKDVPADPDSGERRTKSDKARTSRRAP
jgi:dUTP pyrophosphatase